MKLLFILIIYVFCCFFFNDIEFLSLIVLTDFITFLFTHFLIILWIFLNSQVEKDPFFEGYYLDSDCHNFIVFIIFLQNK